MYPTLFKIGPITLHSYGLMITIAFIVAIWLAARRARAAKLGDHFALDISFILIIVSLASARVTYVVLHWDEFAEELKDYCKSFIDMLKREAKEDRDSG